MRAGRPARQPVYHPNDGDLSLGTPVWRPALQELLRWPGTLVSLDSYLLCRADVAFHADDLDFPYTVGARKASIAFHWSAEVDRGATEIHR